MRWDAAYRWLADVGVDVVYVAPDGDTDIPKSERTGCWAADFPRVLAYKTAYYQQIAVNDWTRNVEGAVAAGIEQQVAEEMMGPRPPAPEVFVDTAWKAGGTKPKDVIAEGVAHESDAKMRCMNAITTLLSGSGPQRHLHLVEALPEWTAGRSAILARALSDMVDAGEIIVADRDGFNWYSLAASSDHSSGTENQARRAIIDQAWKTYDGLVNKKGLPKRRPFSLHVGFKVTKDERRALTPRMKG